MCTLNSENVNKMFCRLQNNLFLFFLHNIFTYVYLNPAKQLLFHELQCFSLNALNVDVKEGNDVLHLLLLINTCHVHKKKIYTF